MDQPTQGEVATRWVWAAEQLSAVRTRSAVLDRIVTVAPLTVPGIEHASVTLTGSAGPGTPAASGSLAERIDALQYQAGQGPCLQASRTGRAVVVSDLATEVRWPRLVALLSEHLADDGQVHGVLALPLRTGSGTTGSLNLFSTGRAVSGLDCAAGSAMAALAVTALAAVEQQERAATREMQTASFLAALAHDLRSGMTVALTAHEILTHRRARLDADGQEALDLLTDELNRQRQLLVDLLDLVRARDEGDSRSSTALLPVVRDAVARHRRRVPVHVEPSAATARVVMHPVQLTRIVMTLLDNADQHAGGATLVRVGTTGDRAWVAVEDAGPGVPATQRERIFTCLTSVPAPGHSGLHMGLALSRQHARWADGDLVCQDRDGGGARFVLHLPTGPPDLPPAGTT